MNRIFWRRWIFVSAVCVACAVPAAAQAAERVEVRARDVLTAKQFLRGVMTFSQSSEWADDPKSGVYTARFVRRASAGCTVQISASIRGKATRATSAEQVKAAVGHAPSHGTGDGRSGPYAVHEVEPNTIYGILVTRAASRRFGHLRIFAIHRECSEEAKTDTAEQVGRALRGATARLRVS